MISYWEKQSFLNFDVAIIGAGITGLSAAISLKEKQPNLSVAVFERGILPSGASTKNAGFACIGSAGEILSDLSIIDTEKALQLVQLRLEGLQLLRNRLGDKNIRYRENGSFELLNENELDILDKIEYLNNLLKPITKKQTYSIQKEEVVNNLGINKNYFKAIIQNNCEGELHTGEMMKSLYLFAIQKGVQVFTGCNVQQVESENNSISFTVGNPIHKSSLKFVAKKIIAATNAFTNSIFPNAEVKPGRGIVVVTKPISNLKLKGIFHFDEGFYYFREIDNRILFGGGRNLDFEGETTTEFGINSTILNDLLHKLKNDILPENNFEIDFHWSGIMAFGKDKFPNFKWLQENIFGVYKMGGMGVAIGSKAGEIAAEEILNSLA